MTSTDIRRRPFQGQRIEARTSGKFDEICAALRTRMGVATIPDLAEIATRASGDEFSSEVERRFVGSSGFMLFYEIDHGSWMSALGIERKVVRWILGNPLIAITLLRHDIAAGLFAPVEMLISETESGGTELIYVLPSSLMMIEPNADLEAAALNLDKKVAELVADATAAVEAHDQKVHH